MHESFLRRVYTRRTCLTVSAGLSGIIAAPGVARATDADKPLIVTTLPQIAASLDAMIGRHCRLRALVPPQGDPHAYRLARSDIAELDRAAAVISIGLGLEAGMAATLDRLARAKPLIALAGQVPARRLRHAAGDGADNHGAPGSLAGGDPHIWLDPDLWAAAVTGAVSALRDAGIVASPAAEAGTYEQRLSDLAAAIEQRAQDLPEARRVIISAHDSLGYFGRRFGFETHAARGAGALGSAGLKRIEELTDLVVARRVPVLFREAGVNDQSLRAIRDAAARRGHRPRLSAPLRIATSDSAGVGGYVAMMKALSDAIIGGLGQGG